MYVSRIMSYLAVGNPWPKIKPFTSRSRENFLHMGISLIDCHYVQKETAAVYLIWDENSGQTEAALVETNTPGCLKYVLEEMAKNGITRDMIKYLFVTHIHLDHSGGAPRFLEEFPNATVVCHPMGVRYLKDPSRIIKGARAVYGDALFDSLYGEIPPIAPERILAAEDGQEFFIGKDKVIALFTPGHASHHIAIYHPATSGVFSGDVFGVSYPGMRAAGSPYLLATTSPTEFEPDLAIESMEKILATGATRIYLTHFGIWEDAAGGGAMLRENLEHIKTLISQAMNLENPEIYPFIREKIQEYFDGKIAGNKIPLTEEERGFLKLDLDLNAQGIAYYTQKRKKKQPA